MLLSAQAVLLLEFVSNSTITSHPQVERALIRELAAGRDSPERLADLFSRADFSAVETELRRQRLLSLLGERLVLAAGAPSVPAAFVQAVAVEKELDRSASAQKLAVTWGLLKMLEADGVAGLPLKGPFLALRLHGDASARVSSDVDLLVSATQMSSAISILKKAGCQWAQPSDTLPRLHHVLLVPDGPVVELHWRIHWYETVYADVLLRRSHVSDGIRVPRPVDDLVSLLLFHARDGLAGLRTPVDVVAWWSRYADAQTPADVKQILREFPALARPVLAAARSVQRVLGLSLQLAVHGTESRRTTIAVNLTDWELARASSDADAAMKAVDGLLTNPTGFGAYLRRTFLPLLPGPTSTLGIRRALYSLALCRRMLRLARLYFARRWYCVT